MTHSAFDVERELRRIGVDLDRLGGLATTAPMTAEAMLRWLRWLPTRLGHAEFVRRLSLPSEEGGPARALSDPDLPPAAPGHGDPEIDARQALQRELERVVWPALRARFPGESYGVNFSHGEDAALANLQRLPDDASYEAVVAALEAPAPPE